MRLNLPGLTVETLPSGTQRYRVRVEGQRGRKIRLHVTPDHPDFLNHYHDARLGKQNDAPVAAPPKQKVRSLGWLIDGYVDHLASMAERGAGSHLTLKQRRNLLERLKNFKHASGSLYADMHMDIPSEALIGVRDDLAHVGSQADNMMKAVKSMFTWSCERGITKLNPAAGIPSIYKTKGGAVSWSAADLRTFKKAHPPGTMAHLALTLMMFTGARSNDVIWIGRDQEFLVDGIRFLGWQPRKRGSAYVELPMAPPLITAIKATAKIGPAYILQENGMPYKSPDSFRNRMGKWVAEAGLKGRSAHGVRKALAQLIAEEGGSEHQIMSVLAHTQPKTSAIYTKGAQRRRMAADAMRSIAGLKW